MISTGTIPVEHKSVHWLSMGATGKNHLWGGGIPAGGFLGTALLDNGGHSLTMMRQIPKEASNEQEIF